MDAILRDCTPKKKKQGTITVASKVSGENIEPNKSKFFAELYRKKQQEQIEKSKAFTQCHHCGSWGQWWSDHREDGSLKPGAKSF